MLALVLLLLAGGLRGEVTSSDTEALDLITYADFLEELETLKRSWLYGSFLKIDNVFEKYPEIEAPPCGAERKACVSPLIELGDLQKGSEGDNRVVLIVAGFHGNEVVGTNALFQFLRGLPRYLRRSKDLSALLGGVRLLLLPMVNVAGFEKLEREEPMPGGGSFDPNRDFPFDAGTSGRCLRTTTARILLRIFAEFEVVGTLTYHGGDNSVSYPWGNFAHEAQPRSPDHRGFAAVAEILAASAGGVPKHGLAPYATGTLQDVVYNVHGGFEDWAYAASWDHRNVPQACRDAPEPYDRPRHSEVSNRAFVFLVEAGFAKVPLKETMGNRLAFFEPKHPLADPGHVSRNLNLISTFTAIMAPFFQFEEVVPPTRISKQKSVKPNSVYGNSTYSGSAYPAPIYPDPAFPSPTYQDLLSSSSVYPGSLNYDLLGIEPLSSGLVYPDSFYPAGFDPLVPSMRLLLRGCLWVGGLRSSGGKVALGRRFGESLEVWTQGTGQSVELSATCDAFERPAGGPAPQSLFLRDGPRTQRVWLVNSELGKTNPTPVHFPSASVIVLTYFENRFEFFELGNSGVARGSLHLREGRAAFEPAGSSWQIFAFSGAKKGSKLLDSNEPAEISAEFFANLAGRAMLLKIDGQEVEGLLARLPGRPGVFCPPPGCLAETPAKENGKGSRLLLRVSPEKKGKEGGGFVVEVDVDVESQEEKVAGLRTHGLFFPLQKREGGFKAELHGVLPEKLLLLGTKATLEDHEGSAVAEFIIGRLAPIPRNQTQPQTSNQAPNQASTQIQDKALADSHSPTPTKPERPSTISNWTFFSLLALIVCAALAIVALNIFRKKMRREVADEVKKNAPEQAVDQPDSLAFDPQDASKAGNITN